MDAREQALHALVHMTLPSTFTRKRQHLSIEQSVVAHEQALHALVHALKLDARVDYSLRIQ